MLYLINILKYRRVCCELNISSVFSKLPYACAINRICCELPRNLSRSLFKKLEVLIVPLEYIFSLMNFIVNNQEHFRTNSALRTVNIRNKHALHRPADKLSCFQKSPYYSGIKLFNHLPYSLKSVLNKKGSI
jgi:hypothetical protein